MYTKTDIERAVGLMQWLMGLDQSIAWHEGLVLTGYTVKRKSSGWLLIVRGYRESKRKGKTHMVSYYDGDTLMDCFNAFAQLTKYHRIRWYDDRWPPNMGD